MKALTTVNVSKSSTLIEQETPRLDDDDKCTIVCYHFLNRFISIRKRLTESKLKEKRGEGDTHINKLISLPSK